MPYGLVKPLWLSVSRKSFLVFWNVVIVIVLSSGGATVLEGILGTAFGLLKGNFGGGFLPIVLLFFISTRDWIKSYNKFVLVSFYLS